MSWLEPAAGEAWALRFSVREDGDWSSPRTIARGEEWFVNWADFPAILALPDGTLAAHWLVSSGPAPYAYDVAISRSTDGGDRWGPPVTPHRDGTRTEHGFVSLFPWSDDVLGAIWLDGRKNAGIDESALDGGPSAGEMTLRHARLEADGRLGDEVELDGRVCDCCQTDVAIAAEGPVVAYRDRSPEEVRDIAVVRWSKGSWSAPAGVHPDGWTIAACPVNGPALAAVGDRVVVAWFTGADDSLRVRLAFSGDGGDSFASPIRVDEGAPLGRVDLALLPDGRALVIWMERVDGVAAVRARRVAGDGTAGESVTLAWTSPSRASGFPRLVVTDGEALLAWTDPGDPPPAGVRVAVAPLEAIP